MSTNEHLVAIRSLADELYDDMTGNEIVKHADAMETQLAEAEARATRLYNLALLSQRLDRVAVMDVPEDYLSELDEWQATIAELEEHGDLVSVADEVRRLHLGDLTDPEGQS